MTPREAICQCFGFDQSELSDYRYHYGHTAKAVYSLPDGYTFAMANGASVPKKLREYFPESTITQATGSTVDFCKSHGVTVWLIK